MMAYGRVSPQAAHLDRDVISITGAAMPVRDYEAVIELTYQMQLAQNWSVQLSVQYVAHPGGHLPVRAISLAPLQSEVVLGIRVILRF